MCVLVVSVNADTHTLQLKVIGHKWGGDCAVKTENNALKYGVYMGIFHAWISKDKWPEWC